MTVRSPHRRLVERRSSRSGVFRQIVRGYCRGVNLEDQPGAFRPGGHPVRMVRSLAAALACVAVAALGHNSAGGHLAAPAILAVFAGGAAITWLLSARRLLPAQIVGLLVLCQVGVHLCASDAGMTMNFAMVASHLAATVVSALLLARGEKFVWLLADRLGIRVAPMVTLACAVPTARPLLPVVAPRSRHDVMLAHSRALRGPPSGD